MNKSIVIGTTLSVLGLGGLGFGAWQVQQAPRESGPQFAEVVAVQPVTRSVETPREVCEDVVVQHQAQAPSRDPHRIAGTAAGAVVGGLLGNQVGGGSGKTLATVAGAVGGGFAGREIQGRIEANQTQTYTTTQRQCHTVMDSAEETVGYDVTWRHGELTEVSRLDHRPQGDRVLLEEGQPRWDLPLASTDG
ncbi:glycine zipper 2TM domain-containing protein [Halomonas sp. MCCC 1A17488]|uniref:Glycine zipper 2TM domain-containing protein n=1 Tax=Billgrantia sulfidoxydans TaxID=2733484 RepID=A0ABX7W774_9GAMM|nr:MULTISPECIES: glycine zipper 2TM domain-containing protein [Halomonas]MCE8014584.1 glycine zipper 2TM domain-containing protein [Halomonas sp. MCCC 1A17488]MCG3237917.1 glycine zipper 2TM domain-containing protein [Halomonas sp. MCCC 1A17488]QPP48297.1 glycine zipper 2TM domain-containing protein [Halomonas sp. SS10-MC5]QTP55605.1 glycine zipper 2TM domain-containing protein [Halomonas sulfidoxydans]